MKYKYNPSLKELHSSLKYRTREYLLENTLHGVPYFVDPTRPKWERLIWFSLTFASIFAIAAIIAIILGKFETDPTITGLDITTEHINIEFPQVFICFDWFHLNHSDVPWFLSFNQKAECPPSKYSCLYHVDTHVTQCDCWLSCDHASYNVMQIQSSKSTNRITLRNWPTALYRREMRFGYLDLLVSFGGIAGLFLGYSLIVSVEIGYYFTLRTYCGAVVQSSREQHRIVAIHVVEKVPRKVDVNQVYYPYVD